MLWLVLLLLASSVSGLFVEPVVIKGDHPSLYGDVVVFEREGNVGYYDLSKREEGGLGPGSNPSIFGFTVAFENGGNVEVLSLRDKNVKIVGAGRNPFVFSEFVVFSTLEQELGVDFSNDGDLDDDILRLYDLKTQELANLKAVGDFPVLGQRHIAFLTEEEQVGVDLNADGDKADKVVRILDRESRQVSNARVAAKDRLSLSKQGVIAFSADGKIALLDVKSQSLRLTNFSGSNPSINEGVVFERGDQLFGLSENNSVAKLGITGSNPSLFGRMLVFVSSEGDVGDLNEDGSLDRVIRFVQEEDSDGDDFSDFVDNCPNLPGSWPDLDADGLGDGCDEDVVKVEQSESRLEAQQDNETVVSNVAEDSGVAWYWYVLIIVFLVVVSPYVWRACWKYHRKRRKGFGF
ncbi:hypothetical protein HY489_06345 [Candidatus Woesearchaeota archaeon]|nr:hypothetical protein [Candidatus Woesearchaeota archaeon]